MRQLLTGLAMLMCLTSAPAAPGVQVWEVSKPLDATYDAVYKILEQNLAPRCFGLLSGGSSYSTELTRRLIMEAACASLV